MHTVDPGLLDKKATHLRSCGFPLRLLRQSGKLEFGRFRCDDRACMRCGRMYYWRVRDAIQETLESADVDELYFVTLTRRPVALGLSRYDYEREWKDVRDHWARTTRRLRRYDDSHRRYREHAPGSKWANYHWRSWPEKLPYYGRESSTWTGHHYPTSGETNYIWAREVTTGRNDTHWHVHAHVITDELATAERIVAAWQAERRQGDPCICHISAPGDVSEYHERRNVSDMSAERLARYVTSYVSKGRSGYEWPEDAVLASWRASTGNRLYDAGGRFRPLGVGERESADDPCVAVAVGDSARWQTWSQFWGFTASERLERTDEGAQLSGCVYDGRATLYGAVELGAVSVGDLPDGGPPTVGGARLETYRNNSQTSEPFCPPEFGDLRHVRHLLKPP